MFHRIPPAEASQEHSRLKADFSRSQEPPATSPSTHSSSRRLIDVYTSCWRILLSPTVYPESLRMNPSGEDREPLAQRSKKGSPERLEVDKRKANQAQRGILSDPSVDRICAQ